MKKKILVLVGPTASGKTGIGCNVAQQLNTEVISADSRQIYKELIIGTAKPEMEILNKVKHHMIDIASITEDYDTSKYCKDADLIIEKTESPLIVGGTGFYINTLIYGIFNGPGKDDSIRDQLENRMKESGLETLFNELQTVDPETAMTIDKFNHRRIIRALEVYHLTGKSISEFYKTQNRELRYDACLIGLKWQREKLYDRINARVDNMIKNGLIDEVADLSKKYPFNSVMMQTVGYSEILEYLDNKISKSRAIEEIKLNTRHYAKRQMTWFNASKETHWILVDETKDSETIQNEILENYYKFKSKG